MQFHEAAAIFPMMNEDEYQALKQDIVDHGLREPIWIYEGKIIDGRNRWNACQELGIDCPSRRWDGNGSLVDFIISMNLHRRHLTASQRAMVALDALPFFEAEAAKRQEASRFGAGNISVTTTPGEARQYAAQAANVNPHYVQDAKAIAEKSPELAEQVREGAITIPQAKRQIKRESMRAIPIPSGKYRVFYADPPWQYGDELTEGYGPAKHHYPTMSIAELCLLPIADMAGNNAVLFMWVTSPILPESFSVIDAWGFKYKASFVWDKVRHNFGHYNSVRHEFLFICTRGSCLPDTNELIDSVQSIERSNVHSEKPMEFRQIIDRLYTTGKRIELFARTNAPGWESWGNEPTC